MNLKELGKLLELLIGIGLIVTAFCLLVHYYPDKSLDYGEALMYQNSIPYYYSQSLLPVFLGALILGGAYLIKGNVKSLFYLFKKDKPKNEVSNNRE